MLDVLEFKFVVTNISGNMIYRKISTYICIQTGQSKFESQLEIVHSK